jgi:hypothetical protein
MPGNEQINEYENLLQYIKTLTNENEEKDKEILLFFDEKRKMIEVINQLKTKINEKDKKIENKMIEQEKKMIEKDKKIIELENKIIELKLEIKKGEENNKINMEENFKLKKIINNNNLEKKFQINEMLTLEEMNRTLIQLLNTYKQEKMLSDMINKKKK